MTPQSEGRYATSLLFTPPSADGRGSGADYRLQKTGANATRSPSPEQGDFDILLPGMHRDKFRSTARAGSHRALKALRLTMVLDPECLCTVPLAMHCRTAAPGGLLLQGGLRGHGQRPGAAALRHRNPVLFMHIVDARVR